MASEFGYASKILKVDLSSASINDVPTSDYADRFVGGRGIAAKMKRLGVRRYGSSGKPADLYKDQGLDAQSIANSAKELLG